ncbi:hypothetical protein F2Q69_00063763 [Brassica cretica]|uniref:HRDC domain-containing protein n=1 Tax=Brassica cretica TaxID=69181 RepID=A0A8S9RLG2_BRACR|nr:hypothetical protein F2Q69_00063763 [Brassica cretica]
MKLNSVPAHVSSPHSNLNLEELQTTVLSRATSLSETALKVLLWERDKLTLEQRFIEDEIAKCDQRIKNIKGDWELQLETILKSCNKAYPRGILQESHDKSACQSNKMPKPSEPLPSTKSMCQKLDDICLENNWVLPSYHVSLSDGGFQAEVRINETQFAHRICGEAKSDAEEARESAAAILLAKYVTPEHTNSQRSRTRRPFRSPSSVKVLKPSTPGETSEKDPLTSIATGDVDLTTNLFLALRKLRSLLVKECPGGVMGTYIFTNPTLQKISTKIPRNKEELLEIDGLGKDKVSRYGDRLLESLEQRFIEDEIAKCDQRIKNIKGDWALQLETILKSCDKAYPRGILQESHDKSACQSNKRLKPSEPLPSTKSMWQKLDDICLENNWVLPSYHVSLSDGGFKAEVRINETQFAHRICGEAKSDAEEARESAAAILLAKYVTPEQTNSQRSRTRRPFRSPSSVKVLKPSTPGETSEKYPLTSLATGDVDLTTNLFLALRKLRSLLVKECPGGVMGTYIFTNPTLQKISTKIPRNKEELLEIDGLGKDKVSRYGDRLLEVIESTIKEYYATNKKSSME